MSKSKSRYARAAMWPLAAVATLGLGLSACDIDKTEEGRMPSVDIDVEGDAGKLPKYDVDTAKVVVGTRKETIEVPDVDVRMEEKEVDVPTMGIEMPEDDDNEVEDNR